MVSEELMREALEGQFTTYVGNPNYDEKRVLKRTSWLRDLWFRTGKPVYRFLTRRVLKWEDNEGQGPKP